ncbi:MAG: PQQ-binding-like beta-propeller repeat protein [Chitinophagales bacterium]|nr:PQQ-binding-like beta-propeller repeat protein [Chitinophagales bacterium]
MIRILMIALMAMGFSKDSDAPKPLSQICPIKWKAHIGNTTLRTNMVVDGGRLYIGSNGEHYKDYALDNGNGLKAIDLRTGKILQTYGAEILGDMDVNGVAILGDSIFFGNDNEEVMCYHKSGALLWRIPASGDVETKPILVNIDSDGAMDLIYATESGEIAAIDTRDGKKKWSFKIKDFSGWTKTDNRYLFKVGAWFSNGNGFMAAPAVADLNKDKVADFVYMARDGNAYALNGKNGTLLWKLATGVTFNSFTPLLENNDGHAMYMPYVLEDQKGWHQYLIKVNSNGKIVSKLECANLNYHGGLTQIGQRIISPSYDTIVAFEGGKVIKMPYGLKPQKQYYWEEDITAQVQYFDLMKLGHPQYIVLRQNGLVEVMDDASLVPLRKYSLPNGTETTPLITDADNDGKLEMLVSCYDGYLYCFSLGIPSKQYYSSR